jgi:hypothetical protein
MIRPPTIAPGRLLKPPTTAAGNAFRPMKPMLACTKVIGASSSAAIAATPAARPHTMPLSRCTGMPM